MLAQGVRSVRQLRLGDAVVGMATDPSNNKMAVAYAAASLETSS
jgi:hypothetical protein